MKRFWEWGGGYPSAVAAVAVVTLVCLPFREQLGVEIIMLLYVPVVVGAARLFGTRVSMVTAVLAVLVLNFVFTQPYYQLNVYDPLEWVALIVFLIAAVIAGQQTGQMHQRTQSAIRRQRELALLNRLSFHVVSDKSVSTTAELIVSQVASLPGVRRAAVYARHGRTGVSLLAYAGDPTSDDEQEYVDWVMASDKAIGLPHSMAASIEPRPVSVDASQAIPGKRAEGLYLPLQTTEGLEGVLHARTRIDADTPQEDLRFLVAVANLAGAALERKRLEAEAAELNVEREADRLKSTIVSSVSHELKTPLAAAIARVSSLAEAGDEVDAARLAEELAAVSQDLARLNAAIVDLLDVSRLESDAWRPQPDHYEVSEILGTVASAIPTPARERLDFEVPAATPYVFADFSQLVRALANIVDNALVYSPASEHVRVAVTYDSESVFIEVEDRGAGVSNAEKGLVFSKFFRGSAAATVPGGTGLGLAIAQEIVGAQGGSIRIEDAEPHGARFIVTLPVAVIGAEAE